MAEIDDLKLEKKVETVMMSKVQLIYALLIILLPVCGFFFKIQLDVALIKQNHEAHIQTAMEKIAALEKQELELEKKLDTDHEAIILLMNEHKELK